MDFRMIKCEDGTEEKAKIFMSSVEILYFNTYRRSVSLEEERRLVLCAVLLIQETSSIVFSAALFMAVCAELCSVTLKQTLMQEC